MAKLKPDPASLHPKALRKHNRWDRTPPLRAGESVKKWSFQRKLDQIYRARSLFHPPCTAQQENKIGKVNSWSVSLLHLIPGENNNIAQTFPQRAGGSAKVRDS